MVTIDAGHGDHGRAGMNGSRHRFADWSVPRVYVGRPVA